MGRRVLPLMALLGLCLAVALPAGAGDASHIRPRIVNGVLTPAFPTVGAILNPADPDTGSVGCTGTLIGCETLLTAAHCVCPSDLAPCVGPDAPDPSTMGVFFQHAGFFSVTSIALRSDFDFPVGDVAVLKLGAPVTGIAPTPIDTLGPVFGTTGTIVGFGRSGGSQSDYGLKRSGDIVTASCAASGVSNTTSVCWNFTAPVGTPGTDSNTCNADSGGPLFIDYGSGPVIAGVTSGGQNPNCLADDASVDAKVAQYAAWIQTEGGADLANTSCGSGPQVGGDGTTIVAATGSLSASLTQRLHSFEVGTGAGRLRVGFNAHDSGTADFNLYVKAGSVPTPSDFDCAADGSGQFGFCEFAAPTPGTWYALVDRVVGSGTYQLTFTSFGPDCALPESAGLPCNDGNVCTEGDICQSGDCVGSALPDGTACDDADPCTRPDTCQAGTCVNDAVPLSGCGTAAQSALLLKQKGGPKDKLLWKWVKGAATDPAEFGSPTSGTDYAFCLYAGTAAVLAADIAIPADPLKWSPLSDRGYKYKDPDATINGMQRVLLKGGDAGKAKILLKGAGDGLPDPPLGLALPVKVQLVNLDNDACWEADYDLAHVIKNESGQFKVKRND